MVKKLRQIKQKKLFKTQHVFFAGLFLFSLTMAAVSGLLYYDNYENKVKTNSTVEAVTRTRLKSNLELIRLRVTFNDVIAGTDIGGNPSRKKVTVFTVNPGDQIVSLVSNVTTGFSAPGADSIEMRTIRAEINGNEVSNGDIIQPRMLNVPEFNNGKGEDREFMLWSGTESTSIVMTVEAVNGTSLNTLTAGQMDFYAIVII